MAENTDIEWSNRQYENDKGETQNVVVTQRNPEKVNGDIADNNMRKGNYKLKKADHNHPNNSPNPSGGDMETQMNYKKEGLNVISRIYTKISRQYHNYNEKGSK